ncbi:GNAT family N-acetyltransferase [Candidatus Dependentiae bacterium]|nr:GNAT family N-acetyltransferase [Candidatus Dependentiae bacterium]
MEIFKKSIFSSLLLIITTLLTFSLSGCRANSDKGTIVILNGTSSAGKSSISKVLKEKYGYEYIELDEYAPNEMANYLEKLVFQREGKRIKIPRKDVRNEIEKYVDPNIFKKEFELQKNYDDIDEDDIVEKTIRTTELKMIEDAKKLSCEGKNVIIDLLFEKELCNYVFWKDQLKGFNAKFVLVYLPLNYLIKRVRQRNEWAERTEQPYEKASVFNSLEQFISTYKKQDNKDEIILGKLDKDQFIKVCEFTKNEYPFKKDQFKKFVNKLKKELGFTNKKIKSIKITPRLSYDLIINTKEKTPEECAKKINKLVSVIKEWKEKLKNGDVITFKAYNTPLVDKELMAKLRNIWFKAYLKLFTDQQLDILKEKGLSKKKVAGLTRKEIKKLIKNILKGKIDSGDGNKFNEKELEMKFKNIITELVEEYLNEDWPEDEREFDSTRGKEILKAGIHRIIVFKNNSPIGYINFVNDFVDYDGNIKKVLGPNEKWIEPLMVHPSAQGLGLGRKLVFSILKLYPNTKRIILVTDKDNKGACKFYKRIGFIEKEDKSYGYDLEGSQLFEWINPKLTKKKELKLKK